MKHLKLFKEAIVDWETDNIKSFYNELKDRLSNLPKLQYAISFNDLKEVGEKYDIEVVDYDTFLNDLPTEKMKKDAPPRLLDFIYHMLKHENVHVGQKSRKIDKSAGEYLGDVTKTKEYFSNKDEVMAFAQSVSDMIMDMNPKSLEDAIKMIERTPLWRPISTTDEKTKRRYKKYIYLYLEKEFEKGGKKNIKPKSIRVLGGRQSKYTSFEDKVPTLKPSPGYLFK